MKKLERNILFSINCFSFMVTGLSGNIGSALPELQKIFRVNLIELSHGMTLAGITNCLGSLIATYTLDKWNRQIQFAVALILGGISTILLPLSSNITYYYILYCIIGFFASIPVTVPNVTTAELFSGNSSFQLQLQNFFYSIGLIITPLIISPFLSDEINEEEIPILNNDTTKKNSSEESKVWIAYLLIGVLEIIVFLMVVISYFVKPYQVPKKEDLKVKVDMKQEKTQIEKKEIEANLEVEKENELSTKYIVFFLTMTSILITLQIGNEMNSSSFIPSFLIKSNLKVEPKQAAYMTTFFFIFLALGRLLSSILSIKIKIDYLIILNCIIMFIGNVLLLTLGVYNIYIAWISLAILGIGFSSTVPLVFCYVENNIKLTTKYSSIFNFVISFYASICPPIISGFLESEPNNFIIFNIIVVIIMLAVFFCLAFFKNAEFFKKK